VQEFAAVLTQLGHEVEVLTPYKRGARHDFAHRRTTYFPWLGCADSVAHLRLSDPVGAVQLSSLVLTGCMAAVRLVRRFQPDHVLCFWAFPCGLWARVAWAATGVPYSLWALGSDVWALGKLPGMPQVFQWLARAASHRYADGLQLANDFSALTGTSVEFLATSRRLEPPRGVEQGEGGYYLYLGRYHTNKGIDLLVEAVARAGRRLPANFRLLAHGFGPLESQVRQRVLDLGLADRISLRGPAHAEEVAVILRRARGLIIPSRIESIPLVLSDGLQMALPLLVTDVGDMGALVRRYGAGTVCRAQVDELSDALVRFVTNPPSGGNPELQQHLDIRQSARRFLADVGQSSPPL
jgi:glycosyltransferase involved in cell wall biosynthesis